MNQQQIVIPGNVVNSAQPISIPSSIANSGQPIVIQIVKGPSTGCSRVYTNYNGRASIVLSVIQIVCGVLSVVFKATAIHFGSCCIHHIGYGFFSPIFWFIAAAFGLASACSKIKCTVITFMVMSIISAVTIVYFIPLACTQIKEEFRDYNRYEETWYEHKCIDVPIENSTSTKSVCTYINHDPPLRFPKEGWPIAVAMSILLAIVAATEGVAAILSSVLCCRVLCCGRSEQTTDGPQVRYVVGGADVNQGGATGGHMPGPQELLVKKPPSVETVEAQPSYTRDTEEPMLMVPESDNLDFDCESDEQQLVP